MSENKTQTVSVSTLVKKVIIKFLLFNDLPSYLNFTKLNERKLPRMNQSQTNPPRACGEQSDRGTG